MAEKLRLNQHMEFRSLATAFLEFTAKISIARNTHSLSESMRLDNNHLQNNDFPDYSEKSFVVTQSPNGADRNRSEFRNRLF